MVVNPKRGLAREKETALAEKLAKYKASLSQEELEKLVADTKHLKEYQDAEETEEALKTIPLLKEKISAGKAPKSTIQKNMWMIPWCFTMRLTPMELDIWNCFLI